MDKLAQPYCNATHCNTLQCTHSLFDVAKETYKKNHNSTLINTATLATLSIYVLILQFHLSALSNIAHFLVLHICSFERYLLANAVSLVTVSLVRVNITYMYMHFPRTTIQHHSTLHVYTCIHVVTIISSIPVAR